MKKQNSKKWGILLISTLLLAGLVVPVFASDSTEIPPDQNPEITGEGVRNFFAGVLARTFRYQASMTEFIGSSLKAARGSFDRSLERISNLGENGKDVIFLEEAIIEFDELIDLAEKDFSAAQSIINLHSGFDEDGFVEELNEASETVRAVEPHITSARENMVAAIQTMVQAIREYQEANPE